MVEWDDAATTGGWHKPNSRHLRNNCGLSRCETIGFFLRETKKSIQLSKSYSDTGDRLDTQAIPFGMIRKVRRLK